MKIFRTGQTYSYTDWFTGGLQRLIVTGREERGVSFKTESHEADGDFSSAEVFDIEQDTDGNESVLIYEYKGHENRLIAEDVTREQAYAEYYKLATKPVGDGKPELDGLREATLVYEKFGKGGDLR